MATIVDARGKKSPQPEAETRAALQEADGAPVIALVDHEIACRNVENMAAQMGLSAATDRLEDGTYRMVLQPLSAGVLGSVLGGAAAAAGGNMRPAPELPPAYAPLDFADRTPPATGPVVAVLASERMGEGDEELGVALMCAFVRALTRMRAAPDVVLLYNRGVKLAMEGAETADDLKALARSGCEILACSLSLERYGLTNRLAAGRSASMTEIAAKLVGAGKIIRL